jgi:hypothetical protein
MSLQLELFQNILKKYKTYHCAYYPYVELISDFENKPKQFSDKQIDILKQKYKHKQNIIREQTYRSLNKYTINNEIQYIKHLSKIIHLDNKFIIISNNNIIDEDQFPILKTYHKDTTFEQIIFDFNNFDLECRKYNFNNWIICINFIINIKDLNNILSNIFKLLQDIKL